MSQAEEKPLDELNRLLEEIRLSSDEQYIRGQFAVAIHKLEQAIEEEGGIEKNREANDVLKRASKVNCAKYYPVVGELLLRTAIGVRAPENEANRQRYPEVIREIREQDAPNCISHVNVLVVAAAVFFTVMMFGAGLLLLLASNPVGLGVAMIGMAMIFGAAGLLTFASWKGVQEITKKPVLADIGWAAARFCRDRLWSPPPAGPGEARDRTPARPQSDLTRPPLRA